MMLIDKNFRMIVCLMVINATFNDIYIVATSFSGGKPPTYRKSLTNFIMKIGFPWDHF
jgi:multisubunit Na+/H+ antiporter MnhC subunit